MLLLLLILGLGCVPALRLHAQNVDQPLALQGDEGQLIQGRIDWTDQVLIAYGEAAAPDGITNPVQRRLMGFRGAKVAAYRNLLELAGQVQVDSETRVVDAMVASDEIRTRVSGLIQGARVVPGSQQEVGGLYTIALELELLDEFSEAVLPDFPAERPAPSAPPLPPPTQADSLDSVAVPMVFTPPEPYTGLLVDARGLDLQPSMAPQVLGEDGRQVYSPAFVERVYAARVGVVGYDKDLERASGSDRLGGADAHPLVVKALEVTGPYRADPVIGWEDAVRVAMADAESDFLRECRVVFVLGPEPEPAFADSTAIDSLLLERDALDLPGEAGTDSRPQ